MAGIIEVKDQGVLRIYDADNSNYVDIVVPSTVSSNRTITIPDATFTIPTSNTPDDDAITAAKLNNDIISGTTALTSEPADTDEFLVSDAGTLKRIDYSLIKGGGLTEVDLLRKSANQAISASTASVVSANWERDDTLSEKIGNGMSESSGVFTFPSTGIYLIQSQMYLYGFGSGGGESAQYVQLLIQGTADNSNFVTLVDSSIPATANTGVRYVTNRAHTIFDCTNTSTHKVKFQVWIQGKSGTLYGSSSVNASFASFIKLGDT